MSIVEKAAARLKAQQEATDAAATPAAAVAAEVLPPSPTPAAPAPSTIERVQERTQPLPAATPAPEEPLWHIDMERLRRADLAPIENDAQARFDDELRRVKRPLLNNAGSHGIHPLANGDRIVVTSAVPGEGKTFTTLNLALSLAREPDFEVLLVDGDIPKADITRSLGLEGRPGLMDALVDEKCRPEDVIVRTDVPNLLVVPTGQYHTLTAERFGGRRMQNLLNAWGDRARQRLIVFDSSPLLATPEAPILAAHMGQVVMVVAAGRTRQRELKAAMENLSKEQYIGLVLNMSRLPTSETHYYGHYGQHYGGDHRGEA